MSVASDSLAFFRTQWAERFVDTCVVKRQTGSSFNDTTGVRTPTFTTQYSGPCLVRPRTSHDTQYGQEQVVVFNHVLELPWDEDDPARGDLADITSTRDGKLNGKQFIVNGIPTDTYNTHRILLCQDNQGG